MERRLRHVLYRCITTINIETGVSEMIHPSAILGKDVTLADRVTVGPYSIIDGKVTVGSDTIIESHVVIRGPCTIGSGNHFFQFSSIGEIPQDKKFQGEDTFLEIGNNNVFRECCTVNRGTVNGGGKTTVGSNNLFMNATHVAHDCIVGNHNIMSAYAALAGHVEVEDHVIFSGYAGAHQFIRFGSHAFLSAGSVATRDVLPYCLAYGLRARATGINLEGMKRHNFSDAKIREAKMAYRILYRQGLSLKNAVDELRAMASDSEIIEHIVRFIDQSSRGLIAVRKKTD